MNLAFKSISKVLLLTVTYSLLSLTKLSASECATISFSGNEVEGEGYVIVLVGSNGRAININGNLVGIEEHYLEEGEHSLIIEVWNGNDYKKIRKFIARKNKNRGRLFKKIKVNNVMYEQKKIIKINVKADHNYNLELQGNLPENEVILQSKTKMKCNIGDQSLLLAKKNVKADTISGNTSLPEELEYRLRRVMAKIHKYHNEGSEYKAYSNIVPVKFNDYFGTVIDKQYAVNGSLKVLSVLPYSVASKLGLASGDNIISFNGQPVKASQKSPTTKLTTYLSSIKLNKNISIQIIRNGNKLTLNTKNVPVVIPEISYQVGLNTTAKINN